MEDIRFFILLFLFISNIISHILLLSISFAFMDLKPPFRKVFQCGFLSMLLYVVPIIAADIFAGDPLIGRVWVYRFFITINPLSALALYFFIKPILGFSPTRSSIIMYHQLLLDYLFCLVYLLSSETFTSISNITIRPDGFFPLDYVFAILRIIIQFILLLIVKARLKKSRRYLSIPPNYIDKNVTRTVLQTFFVICTIYIVIALFRTFFFSTPTTSISACSAFIYALLIIDILLYLSYMTSQFRNRFLNWEIQATGTSVSSLLHTNQEFRAIKHDFYNVLQGYGGYLAIQDYEGLSRYHKKLFSATKEAGDSLNIIEVLRSRIAVYSLLESMAKKAKKSGVSFSIHQICEVTNIVLDDIDLCRVLGILLDNSIEEAELSKGGQVNISFEQRDKNSILIVISNTTNGEVNTKDIFKEGYTTKLNHSGIGLPQVMNILNLYEHCSLRINYHGKQFTIFLILNTDNKSRF